MVSGIHGYLSVVICFFGVLTNIFNITVLMAKDMRTATNYLLTFIAVSDILTMLPYIPYVINFYCPFTHPEETPWKYTYGWVLYMVIMVHLLATTHTISIWLAVTLAAFRFCQIRSPCPSGPLAKDRRITQVKIASLVIYLASILVLIPNYAYTEIEQAWVPESNSTVYTIKEQELATPRTEYAVFINILTYAIVAKIVPCVLILIFSGSLLYHMGIKAARRRQRLCANRQQANTTRMLLVVLILFILTELPQGIVMLLSATVPDFSNNVHFPLGDLIDFISLLNNAINFILYCLMSQQFRKKFFNIYIKPVCDRRGHVATSNSELLILREQVPRTMTMTTHDDNVRV
ncbi:unnamed protein product [Candidula unifasciata]|uniref:G-protein coupled receptors family 1 profile domain-containing protein n=1 Tax=Candidula unifasciata TaxID=100452 RepID=A0A8S3ZV30_9EUPU|nr:unnamed protein product [Candidula unifasciata]